MMMAYAGLRNKRLVELLQQYGVNAVGLSGLDGRVIQARRNRGIRAREGGKLKLLRDLSGKPRKINRQLLDLLLDNGYTPVLTVPLLDENSCAVNSENDDVVALLQAEYGAKTVVNLIEAPGFLEDADNEATHIPRMSRRELKAREESANGRMKRKLRAVRKLLDHGPVRVVISDGRGDRPLRDALDERGTVIQ
jgi:acetylglutamate/LysW-gamma-L-alpha-aminoadipate kinase